MAFQRVLGRIKWFVTPRKPPQSISKRFRNLQDDSGGLMGVSMDLRGLQRVLGTFQRVSRFQGFHAHFRVFQEVSCGLRYFSRDS